MGRLCARKRLRLTAMSCSHHRKPSTLLGRLLATGSSVLPRLERNSPDSSDAITLLSHIRLEWRSACWAGFDRSRKRLRSLSVCDHLTILYDNLVGQVQLLGSVLPTVQGPVCISKGLVGRCQFRSYGLHRVLDRVYMDVSSTEHLL